MIPRVLFTGCSYCAGCGFAGEKQYPKLWVNLLSSNNDVLKTCETLNASKGGRSNAGIFQDTVWYLTREHFDYALVSWTSMPRYELELGLELYDTNQAFVPNSPCRDHNLNTITYSQDYLNQVRDRFTSLAHLHFEIINLLYYINSLVNLARKFSTKIFFINALCPWDNNYFLRLENFLPNQTSPFTQQQIGLETRDDNEFFQIYKKMHDQYEHAGGIQPQHWLNLYESMRTLGVDVNDDGTHPGVKSNLLYYNKFDQALRQMM